jgi:DNA-binding response OmpR family regulator
MSLGKILIVDDDANLLELIKMRLESADYEVTAAREEDDAIAALKAGSFDLCIVDLMLANRDGITLMEECRQPRSTDYHPDGARQHPKCRGGNASRRLQLFNQAV